MTHNLSDDREELNALVESARAIHDDHLEELLAGRVSGARKIEAYLRLSAWRAAAATIDDPPDTLVVWGDRWIAFDGVRQLMQVLWSTARGA